MKFESGCIGVVIFTLVIGLASPYLFKNAYAREAEKSSFEAPRVVEPIEESKENVVEDGQRGDLAVGSRYTVLPDSANAVIINSLTYYMDINGIYYFPCSDDDSVFCVVEAPQHN